MESKIIQSQADPTAITTMSGHAPDEISEFLDSLWQYFAALDVPIHRQLLGGFHPGT